MKCMYFGLREYLLCTFRMFAKSQASACRGTCSDRLHDIIAAAPTPMVRYTLSLAIGCTIDASHRFDQTFAKFETSPKGSRRCEGFDFLSNLVSFIHWLYLVLSNAYDSPWQSCRRIACLEEGCCVCKIVLLELSPKPSQSRERVLRLSKYCSYPLLGCYIHIPCKLVDNRCTALVG